MSLNRLRSEPDARDAYGESTGLTVPMLAGTRLRDAFTGHRVEVGADATIPIARVLADFPLALLGREP